MKRYSFVFVAMVAVFALACGCQGMMPPDRAGNHSTSGTYGKHTGTVAILVTDAPPGYDIKAIEVTVSGSSVAIHKAEASQNQESDENSDQVQEREQIQETYQIGGQNPNTNSGNNKNNVNNKGKGHNDTDIPGNNPGSPAHTTAQDPSAELYANVAEQSEEHGGGWTTVDVLEGKGTFDLLQIQGVEDVLAVGEVEPGQYTQIRMAIERVEVTYAVDSGTQTRTVEAKIPSGKLKFTHPFHVEEGKTTSLVLDFIADKSIVFTGSVKNGDKPNIIFKPVIKLSVSEPVESLDIATVILPDGEAGTPYIATLAATGGNEPYTWEISSGTLPGGLALGVDTGIVSGTPGAAGDYSFTAMVTDSSPAGLTDVQELSIHISDPLAITTNILHSGTANAFYTSTLQATGGKGAYLWSVVNPGSLPGGLELASDSGIISGTPTLIGTYIFDIRVQDQSIPVLTDTKQLSIEIN